MRTGDQWLPDLRRMVEHVEADPPSIGVLSMGEQCAVALVLDKENSRDLVNAKATTENFGMRPRSYTWLDCVDRIEPELLAACIKLQRERS